MVRNFAVLLLLASFFAVVRPGAIEPSQVLKIDASEADQQVLSTGPSDADQQIFSTEASGADRQVLGKDASDAAQQVLSTEASYAEQQVLGTVSSGEDQQVLNSYASDADQQILLSNAADQLVEDRIKDLRIEMLKFQILSKLDMKSVPPPAAVPGTPSEFPREAIRLLLQQDAEAEERSRMLRQAESVERLVINALGDKRECVQIKESSCQKFRYEISASLNTSAVDLWIYKLGVFPKWISVSVSFNSNFNNEKFLNRFYFEQHEAGWNKLPLPPILLPTSWNDTVSYQVEISGDNIAHHGDHRPFLMVSKSYSLASRRRRDVNCDTNESCCVKPLRVSFRDIGFNWVLYPEYVDANYCTGACRLDHGEMSTHYERAMSKAIEKDVLLQGTLGKCWTLCCKPKDLAAVRVIYNDTKGVFHDQYIPELVVESCSCS